MPTTKIAGANGDWELDVTDNAAPTRDRIKIKFTPKQKADGCKDIRLAQTLQAEGFDKDGKRVARRLKDCFQPPPDYPCEHLEDDGYTDGDGNVVVIDHVSCEKDPFYNGNDAPNDKSSQGDATKTPPDATEMSDAPVFNPGNIKPPITRVVRSFRTCAICVDTGAILGCVYWTTEAMAGNSGQISVNDKECPAADAFKEALKKFVQGHTKKKQGEQVDRLYCPDDKSFGDPLPPGLKTYLAVAAPQAPGVVKQAAMLRFIDLDPERAGGAASFASVSEALASVLADPSCSALKFTWTGLQTKTLSSIILSPQELFDEIVAPFLDNRPEMMNDFEALQAHKCSPDLMCSFAQVLQENQSRLAAREIKPVMITIIGNIGRGTAASFTVGMEPSDFLPVVNAASRDAEAATRTVLDYLRLNMGLDRPAVASAPPLSPSRNFFQKLIGFIVNFFRRLFGRT